MSIKSKVKLLLTLTILSLVLAACGQRKLEPVPPHYGMFFIKDNEYIEINVIEGDPEETATFMQAPEAQPLLALWDPQADVSLMSLMGEGNPDSSDGSGPRGEFPFQVAPGEQGVLQLRSSAPLAAGQYCFVQGNFMLPPNMIKHYCFAVVE